MRLAWVTSSASRGRDTDEPLGLHALRAAGAVAEVADWDDPAVDWSLFDRVVVRSTWDYPERIAEFVAWLHRVEAVAELVNPIAVMRWSMDKHYLAELDRDGIPTTPSTFVEPGEHATFPSGAAGFVVKPAVGAGSRDVVRYPEGAVDAAHEHVAALHATHRTVVVQPTLRNVALLGEWPMVFLGGTFSHAASKSVVLPVHGATDDLFAPERNRPAVATPAMREVAEAVIAHVHARVGPTTYARIDLVLDDEERPVVLEAELVEPSLFLPEHPPAAARLADVLVTA